MISKSDIKKLAHLARIDIPEAEEEALRHDLERILAYVGELKEADTEMLDSLAHGTDLKNVMQPDAQKPALPSDPAELLAAAPDHHGRYVRVRSVWS